MGTTIKSTVSFAIGFLMLVPGAGASNGDVGNIQIPHFTSNGALIFYHDGARTGSVPSCASNMPTRWVIDANTAGGKLQAAGLMTAYSLSKRISVVGTGSCEAVWSDTEGVAYFRVHDQ